MLKDVFKLNELLAINRDLNSTLNPDDLLDMILKRISQSLNAEASSIVLIDENDRLKFHTTFGDIGDEIKKITLSRGEGIVGWVIEKGESVLIENAENDSRFNKDISKEFDFPNKSIICVPLKRSDSIIGCIEVINSKNRDFFSAEDLAFLEAFAEQVTIALKNAVTFDRMNTEMDELKSLFDLKHEIVGRSDVVFQILRLLKKLAPRDIIVLIEGKSGTGKELIAQAIHYNSPRCDNSFVSVNCAAIPDELIESELFGHEKGAFTGAETSRKGKFELAHEGTLFLDEIGDMSLKAQAKVLRAIQDQIIQRVGGSKDISVNTRIIAATNKDLLEEMKEGNFREDLYYRLNEFTLKVSPLKDRLEDLPLLIDHFIKHFNQTMEKQVKGIERIALQKLLSYDWPGNIRELKSTVKRAMVFVDGEYITLEDLEPSTINIKTKNINPDIMLPFDDTGCPITLSEIEKTHIIRALEYTNGNKSRACKILDVTRPRLDRKIKSYGIKIRGENRNS
jgi:Nif-specific regulatory protein